MKKRLIALLGVVLIFSLGACEMLKSDVTELKGSITGNTYTATFYNNNGGKTMTVTGTNIDMSGVVVEERTYTSGSGWGYVETLSSVIDITIDGNQMASCGSTIIFAEKGLEPDVDYYVEEIKSEADGLEDLTIVAGVVNKYKNMFGKPAGVIIQSQDGTPICAYSGNSVYWEVCRDLPKTTKLSIDGKALYIHRATFQLVDTALLE